MWVRGLKLLLYHCGLRASEVAPYVGAWIETVCCIDFDVPLTSHPMWVRGLKPPSTYHAVAP